MHRMVRPLAATAAVIALALPSVPVAAATASTQPIARGAGACGLPDGGRKLGPTYALTLRVSGTSCATGVNVIKAYNRCRLKAGGVKGYCHSKVLGFSCSEKRSPSPFVFTANVRCTKGREVVSFSYGEDT